MSIVRSIFFTLTLFVSLAFANEKINVVFSADDGKFSTNNELKYIISKMKGTKDVSKDVAPFCSFAALGSFENSKKENLNLLAVSTGVGEVLATNCVKAVFDYLLKGYDKKKIWDIEASYFSGTAGVSPYHGGMTPPLVNSNQHGGCEADKKVKPIIIGSVCLTTGSFQYNSGWDVELDGIANSGSNSECFNMRNISNNDPIPPRSIFGLSEISTGAKGEAVLKKVLKANPSKTIDVPVPNIVKNNMKSYYQSTKYGNLTNFVPWESKPELYTNCLEASDRSFWIGAQSDYYCRARTYQHLKSLNMKTNDEEFCITAMEGFTYLSVAKDYGVPAVLVRGFSDYSFYPLKKEGDNWVQNLDYITQNLHKKYTHESFHYAIKTSNQVIINALLSTPGNKTSLSSSVNVLGAAIIALIIAFWN